ncbi:hypothetical protein EW146_g4806 [Bondarzewia mesenterica]|uniref:Uncharacterized protein n=1 Tax=Bondarzewia mesenterica TaxID=1095465 RepID=A0A4V3XF18_9AGAM|nr:hypothetical protein EW146_g4806 [Bondarzewia mesenterica]
MVLTVCKVWIPRQGVRIDYAAIIEILIQQLDGQYDEIQQSTALQWLAEFLTFAQEVMVPFTSRLIPAILPNLAHHIPMIQTAANCMNKPLTNVIQSLPLPSEVPTQQNTFDRPTNGPLRNAPSSPSPIPNSPATSHQATLPGQS